MADTVISATVQAGDPEGSFYVRHGRAIERILWILGLTCALSLIVLPKHRNAPLPSR